MARTGWLLVCVLLAGCGTTVNTPTGVAGAEVGSGRPGGGDELALQAPTQGLPLPGRSSTDSSATQVAPGASGGPAAGPAAPGAAGGATGPAGRVMPVGPARPETAPVRVGFLVSAGAGEANSALGINSGQDLEDREIVSALVKKLNERGGLAGRRIIPVLVDHDTQAANYETQLAAACETFARDERVPVVLTTIAYSSPSFEECLDKSGVSFITGGQVIGDNTELARLPALFAPAAMSVDRRLRNTVEVAAKRGVLTTRSRLGVVVDSCAANLRAERKSLLPALSRAGLQVASRAELDCPTGYASAGPAASALQSAILRFRQAEVDQVLVISHFEYIAVTLLMNAAESQQWRPSWLLTSVAYPALLPGSVPAEQLAGATGVGWAPPSDVGLRQQPAPGRAAARCLALARSAGLSYASSYDYSVGINSCDALFLLEELLRRAQGREDSGSLKTSARGLGSVFDSPTNLAGATMFTTTRRDGPSRVAGFDWVTACACFRYESRVRPAT